MFFKANIFKKLITEAHKTVGLTVGQRGTSLFLAGGFWVMETIRAEMPNDSKGELVKVVGELPEPEEVFTAKKGEDNQRELPENEYWNVRSRIAEDMTECEVTNLLVEGEKAVLQNKETRECTLLNRMAIDILETDGEKIRGGQVKGPVVAKTGKTVYWYNDNTAIAVLPYRCQEESKKAEFLRLLENMDLTRK